MKSKITNPKSEGNSKFEMQMFQNISRCHVPFWISDFEFLSDFEIRISDLGGANNQST